MWEALNTIPAGEEAAYHAEIRKRAELEDLLTDTTGEVPRGKCGERRGCELWEGRKWERLGSKRVFLIVEAVGQCTPANLQAPTFFLIRCLLLLFLFFPIVEQM
jgi:hypothetical protein